MIGDLPAPVDSEDGDVARIDHVALFRIETEREDRRMLDEPDLVGCLGRTRIGEALHLVPNGLERLLAEVAKTHGAHSTIIISSLAVSSR